VDQEQTKLLEQLVRAARYSQFLRYRPLGHPDTLPGGRLWKQNGWHWWSAKPWQLDFHSAGSFAKERASISANGVGKSYSVAWECAAHVLGDYPSWYQGWRFPGPNHWWIGAIDADQQRIGIQRILLGADLDQNLGTGFIPRERIHGKVRTRQAGISDIADRVTVRHACGGYSTVTFKTYSQGWRAWQAGAPDGIVLDEEPDENDAHQRDIFVECQTRIFRSSGILLLGMTPLLGETEITRHFMQPKAPGIYCVTASWDDAPHLKEEDKERLKLSYPQHQIEARTLGLAMLGTGRIFNVAEDEITEWQFPIPVHWPRIAGIDFGLDEDHPTSVVWLAHDRENDRVYIYDCYKKTGKESLYHAEAIKARGAWIPMAWPHDGANREKVGGIVLADSYRRHGVNMLPLSARYDRDKGGAQPTEPWINEMTERMNTDRLKVFNQCNEWFTEFRSYHRDRRGDIVRVRNDLMDATRYALIMLKYADTKAAHTAYSRSSARAARISL